VTNLLNLVSLMAGQERSKQIAMLARRGSHEMDHRQRHLSLLDVDAKRFAHRAGVADDVQDVILNLKCRADRQAIKLKPGNQILIRAGKAGAKLAAGRAQNGRLKSDDLEISLLVEREIVSIVDLKQFAFTNLVGCPRNLP